MTLDFDLDFLEAASFDENVSPRLARLLAVEYAGSVHVRSVGLRGADDQRIWNYCRTEGFALVSKDTDFRERSSSKGSLRS